MSSLSFMRADMTTQRSNLITEDSYKILIPKRFGGGYIKDRYWDYGYINHYGKAVYVDANGIKHKINTDADLYGLVAYMNRHMDASLWGYKNEALWSTLRNVSDDIMDILINGDTHNQDIRTKGIVISYYSKDINLLEYPLKLVSASYKHSYEDCSMKSYVDTESGFTAKKWNSELWYKHIDYTELYKSNARN